MRQTSRRVRNRRFQSRFRANAIQFEDATLRKGEVLAEIYEQFTIERSVMHVKSEDSHP
jgi:hypothetical protein